jgi:hypothetical protein
VSFWNVRSASRLRGTQPRHRSRQLSRQREKGLGEQVQRLLLLLQAYCVVRAAASSWGLVCGLDSTQLRTELCVLQ